MSASASTSAPARSRRFRRKFFDAVDASIAKAVAHGATVIVPKSTLPDGDVLAMVLDPAGMPFGLYSR